MLSEFRHLRCNHEAAIGLLTAQFEVLLMIIFGLVKPQKWSDFCHDRCIPYLRCLNLFDHLLGCGFLFLVTVEKHRAVLRAYVRSLAVQGGRVVYSKENF